MIMRYNVELAAALMFSYGFLWVCVMAQRARRCANLWCATVYLILGGLGGAIGIFGLVLALAMVFHANGTWR